MNFPNLVVGRILFAVPFLIFGLFHFTGADNMAGMVPSWLPGGVLWVYLTGVGLVAAPIAVLTGKKAVLPTPRSDARRFCACSPPSWLHGRWRWCTPFADQHTQRHVHGWWRAADGPPVEVTSISVRACVQMPL